jgi:hypothetical protein
MQLFKEYLLRNDIYSPIIEHCRESTLVLHCAKPKDDFKSFWLFLNIKWTEDPYHPNFYNFTCKYPIHNGYKKDKIFAKHNFCEIVNWDEYEDFLNNWILHAVNENNFVPIKGSKVYKTLSIWEVFIYCYDSFFVEHGTELQDLIYKTIDLDKSLEERYVCYQEALLYFSSNYPHLLKVWKYEFSFILNFYAEWLINYMEFLKNEKFSSN